MKDSKIYGSMILSILSSSKNKHSALLAVQNNFIFQGALRLETQQLFETYRYSERKLLAEFMKLIEMFIQNDYPYLAGITLRRPNTKQSPTPENQSIH